jgi:8-oxo-dGTP diphosphatase
METVDTVAFILIKGDKVLVERRRLDKETDPGAVVIPGGHVEEGETHIEALKRELLEELGVTCTDFKFIARMPCQTETEIQMNHWYLCENWKGEPVSIEAEEIFYVDNAAQLDLSNDRTVITKLLNDHR